MAYNTVAQHGKTNGVVCGVLQEPAAAPEYSPFWGNASLEQDMSRSPGEQRRFTYLKK